MSPSHIDSRVVTDKIAVIDRMLASLRDLPTTHLDSFLADPRTSAAAESYLRRALEALMDLGRHLLAKGFGAAINEYAAIADRLHEEDVLDEDRAGVLGKMAKYRNRMVHFYDEINPPELYEIITNHLDDFHDILGSVTAWLAEHPERVRSD